MKDYRYYITLLKQFKSKFADKYGILKIGIFGSVVRGEQTEKSDLEKRCGCPIDLIRLRKSLRPLLLDKILKEGILHKDEITDRLYLIAEAIDVILDRCIKYKHRTTSFPHLGE